MNRRPVRRPAAAAAAPLVLALAVTLTGCSGDDPGGAAEEPAHSSAPSSAPSSTATTPDATSSPTGEPSASSDPSATPSVAPATGLLLQQAHAAVNAPAGWTEGDTMAGYASSAYGPGDYDVLQLSDRPSLAGGATLDQLAQSRLEGLPPGSDGERLPDVELGGELRTSCAGPDRADGDQLGRRHRPRRPERRPRVRGQRPAARRAAAAPRVGARVVPLAGPDR